MGWAVEVVDVTGSTNADLVTAARAGARGPQVLAARAQTAGRGRLGRGWQSAPGASLSASVLVRPAVAQAAWTWLPALVGLGVLDAVGGLGAPLGRTAGAVGLKWPNDVVVTEDPAVLDGARGGLAKLAGILAEAVPGPEGPVGPAVVLGVGINLADPDPGLAGARATSLARVLGREVDLDELLPVLLAALRARLERWERCGGDAAAAGVVEDYRRACTTLGRRVRAGTPAGLREGTAVDLDPDGSLVLEGPDGLLRVSAGDVEHVR